MKSPTRTGFAAVLPGLFFLMLMVFLAMMPRMLIAPLLLRISADLGLPYDRASLFFLTSSAGFIVGLLTSGFVARVITHRWTIVSSLFISGLAFAYLSRTHDEASFHAVLFAGNLAVGFYPGSGIASVISLSPVERRGAALAIHECGPNSAFIFAPAAAAVFAPTGGWRGVMLTMGAISMAAALIFAAFGRAERGRGIPPNFGNLAELFRNRSFWIISVMFMAAATAAMGVYGVLPVYLVVEHGLPETFVNRIVGISRITGYAAILSGGVLVDRFGFRPVVTVVLAVTGAATVLLGLSSGRLLIAAVFVQPLVVGAFFPMALNALADVTAPQRRSLAVALAIPLANLVGAGVAPPLLTAAGAAGRFRGSFVLLGVLIAASLLLLPFMHSGDGGRESPV